MKKYLIISLFFILAGCASLAPHSGYKYTGSVVEYLYPDAKEAPRMQPTTTHLRPPVRVGIAFVPGVGAALSEMDKNLLLERIRSFFTSYEFIAAIDIIPSQYLRPKGGFINLEQAARLLNIEVVALVSYDQVQFNDPNLLSILYWSIIGAYIIHGDQFDIQTMVDASVFDVTSRKLLFRAPGESRIKGSAPLVGFSEQARKARLEGFNQAVESLIPQLTRELELFRERIKTDISVRVEHKPGYAGSGDSGWLGVGISLLLAWLGWRGLRRQ
ncbi:rhombotarget lipoprotein [Candidatus Magnetaquicoccus inordinatus]|uniref:rhombotarget lipoprotein n=1 Tax=Candidatus Magnetaquicoccus inordinatus TaxID=2496818 RepID=UPI001D0DF681|nr:rhombotarget lipoprotein [Candidatus Magnetaquicoccus inordinatus]